jgi:hypothetical protein
MLDIDLEQYNTLGVIADLQWDGLQREQLRKALGPWDIALMVSEDLGRRFMLVAGDVRELSPLVGNCNTEAEVLTMMAIMQQKVGTTSLPDGGITPWVLMVGPEFRERLQADPIALVRH